MQYKNARSLNSTYNRSPLSTIVRPTSESSSSSPSELIFYSVAIRQSSLFVYPTGSTASTNNPKLSFDQQPDTDTYSSISDAQLPPRLFALIIGINNYKSPSIPDLVGAVPDADAVRDYLQKNLGVPSSQIRNLRDSEATRTGIIDGINAFSHNDEIEEGDPILIYYAGHGGLADTPKDWLVWNTDKIELLVPHDHSSLDGNPIHGIPDRTLGVLLSQLAIVKGNNITVILDSCHSSDCTRGLPDPTGTLTARTIVSGTIPSSLDQDIWIDFKSSESLGRGTKVPSGFARSGLMSHVLLAACHSQELAYERTSRGLFTAALLETLVDIGINNLTYTSLLSRMPSLAGKQNPQCEGFFRERSLFNGKVSEKRTTAVFYKMRKSEGGTYVIDAGKAAGITVGAEFKVFQDQNSGNLLGTVVALEPSPFSTTLYAKRSRIDLEQDGVVLKSRAGTEERVRVYVADESLKDLVKSIDPNQIQLVERDRAEFGMALENEKVVFNIYDPKVTKYGLTRMPHSLEPTFEALSPVIRAAAHFYWHHRRTPQSGRGLAKNVEIEVNELEEDFDDEFKSFFKPIPVGGTRKLEVGKDLKLQTETTRTYGWTISNKWASSIYPSLFYFDHSDWSITPYYEPPISGAIVEPPLKNKGHLTVGYGNSGWAPHTFFLRKGQNVDVGVLKLFLSRKQVNLSHVAQLSPFVPGPVGSNTVSSSSPFVSTGGRPSTTTPTPFQVDASRATTLHHVTRESSDPTTWPFPWDTVEFTLVQRRAHK